MFLWLNFQKMMTLQRCWDGHQRQGNLVPGAIFADDRPSNFHRLNFSNQTPRRGLNRGSRLWPMSSVHFRASRGRQSRLIWQYYKKKRLSQKSTSRFLKHLIVLANVIGGSGPVPRGSPQVPDAVASRCQSFNSAPASRLATLCLIPRSSRRHQNASYLMLIGTVFACLPSTVSTRSTCLFRSMTAARGLHPDQGLHTNPANLHIQLSIPPPIVAVTQKANFSFAIPVSVDLRDYQFVSGPISIGFGMVRPSLMVSISPSPGLRSLRNQRGWQTWLELRVHPESR